MTIFGRIVGGGDVEQWCLACVRKWFGTYLSEKERQDELLAGYTQRPRAYLAVSSLEKWPEDQLPCVLIVSTGLAESPQMGGEGQYMARWAMDLACICSAKTEADSRAMAHRYIAALHTLFLQRPSLDGNANGIAWLGETYASLPYEDTRSLAAGYAQFVVQVENIASARAGPVTPDEPLDPDTLPWPDWQQVESYDIDVESVDDVTQPIGGKT